MQLNNVFYADYKAWFADEVSTLLTGSGFSVIGPIFYGIPNPDTAPWNLDWAVIFPDGKYLRITENFSPLPKSFGGAGTRQYFSYHYGQDPGTRDPRGIPKKSDQRDLRIDHHPRWGEHLHYGSEDHIPAERLKGIVFQSLDAKTFVKAVLTHRNTGESLDQVFPFKVEKIS